MYFKIKIAHKTVRKPLARPRASLENSTRIFSKASVYSRSNAKLLIQSLELLKVP